VGVRQSAHTFLAVSLRVIALHKKFLSVAIGIAFTSAQFAVCGLVLRHIFFSTS
jgi:hypothetical protein